ncbi:MAG TPA: hypothetical protein DHS57_07500 [Erysipelotrichaceae bacterium]|nr:hypothetical protein [Erysipelotrichaceae bacterium]HCY07080.1 hypothetical protein [Erysipelotrichaceae bacterium]
MKVIKILFIMLLISGCSLIDKRNISIDDYNYYLEINKQLNFDNVKSIERNFNIEINDNKYNVKARLDVLERGYNDFVYHLYVEDDEVYDSYYVDNINYIESNNEKYYKKVLLNAYTKMVGKYLHTDFVNISYTGIKEMIIRDDSIELILNDSGILEYFNDVYYKNDMYIEEPDYNSGSVNILYILENSVLKQVIVNGEIKYKNNSALVSEEIILNEAISFDLNIDFESYQSVY